MNRTEFEGLLKCNECAWLDWKRDFPRGLLTEPRNNQEWEKAKGTLLKDLASIANCGEDRIGYLVYGVEDCGAVREVTGIHRGWDDADFQGWVTNAFKPPIQFSYCELEFNDTKIVGVFSVTPSPYYPHVACRTINGVIYEGQTWYRSGSRNCVAHYEELKDMFLRREPLEAARLGSQLEKDVTEYYKPLGETVVVASLSDKDNKLRKGYKIAFHPVMRREVRCGDTILMLKPNRQ